MTASDVSKVVELAVLYALEGALPLLTENAPAGIPTHPIANQPSNSNQSTSYLIRF